MQSSLHADGCSSLDSGTANRHWTIAPAWFRLAICAALLLILGAIPFALIETTDISFLWGKLFVVSTAIVMLMTILRADAVSVWRRFRSTTTVKTHWNWWRLVISSAVIVFVVETCSIASYGRFPALPTALGTVLNSLILMCLIAVVFSATNRLAFSAGAIYLIYVFGAIANVIKVQYMSSVVRPLDLQYIEAFSEFFTLFFSHAVIAAMLIAAFLALAGLVVLWRGGHYRLGPKFRILLATASIGGLVGMAYMDSCPPVRSVFNRLAMRKNVSNGIMFTARRGFLFEFVSDIPASFPQVPTNYNKDEVLRTAGRYVGLQNGIQPPAADIRTRDNEVNLVVYLVESLMDPADLGIRFTSDPLANIHRAMQESSGGRMVVPEEYHGSVNTELELVTGMTTSFLPRGACSYVQIVKRDIPTLFEFLGDRGYATFTVHSGPPYLYDRRHVYPFMHIGQPIWMTETVGEPDVPYDAQMLRPSDEALVNAVIKISERHRRFFVYASGNATHSPYTYEEYLGSSLDVCDPLPEPARRELKTYVNAVQAADKAIGRLLDHFRSSPQKTIVVVIGDHWPPLANSREIYGKSGILEESYSSMIPRRRKVPLLVWSNFRGKEPDAVCSANFVLTHILSKMGIEPTGFLAVNNAVRSRLAVLSSDCIQTPDGRLIGEESLPEDIARLLDDYRLLQYDALLGEQWSAKK